MGCKGQTSLWDAQAGDPWAGKELGKGLYPRPLSPGASGAGREEQQGASCALSTQNAFSSAAFPLSDYSFATLALRGTILSQTHVEENQKEGKEGVWVRPVQALCPC